MKPEKWTNANTLSSSSEATCHRDSCRLRIIDEKTGEEECLMEHVRKRWTLPQVANYCMDPAALKFVEFIHST